MNFVPCKLRIVCIGGDKLLELLNMLSEKYGGEYGIIKLKDADFLGAVDERLLGVSHHDR